MAPAPRANPLLLGHEPAETTLLEAMRSGRMHHAWLITGPDGVGKATLAYRFARRLLAGMPTDHSLALDPQHPVFRRVAAGAHADLLTVERAYDEKRKRTRTQIAVDDVRKISGFMSLTPAEGGWRVAIVDGAEELNQASANALLKILEEPPRRAILLLVCGAPGRLLATIRSRCRRLRLDPLGQDAMERLLAAYLPDRTADERGRLVTVAEGSPGRALLLAEQEGLAMRYLPHCLDCRRHVPTRWPIRWCAARPRSAIFSTCCAPASRLPCATWCGGGATRSRRGWSHCVPLMPGATCGTR